MNLIVLILLIVSITCAVLGAASDFQKLRIPNTYSIVIAVCFLLSLIIKPDWFGPWWHHILSGLGTLVLTYIMFFVGMIGGGDSKLATVLALWVGPKGLAAFLLIMALGGGVLGLIGLVIKKKRPFKAPTPGSWFAALQEGRNAVPYGIAITIGAIFGLHETGMLLEIVSGGLSVIVY